jgi:hypothetical protein
MLAWEGQENASRDQSHPAHFRARKLALCTYEAYEHATKITQNLERQFKTGWGKFRVPSDLQPWLPNKKLPRHDEGQAQK